MARSKTVPVDDIVIGDRHRKDMGSLIALADSIDAEGLLQPIGIDHDNRLIFGERRLRAVKEVLGWDRIACRVVNVSSIAAGEYHENEMRKDFTRSERVAILRTMDVKPPGNPKQTNSQYIASSDEAARRVGLGNRETARLAAKVVDQGTPELVAAMDAGDVAPSVAAKIADLPKREQKTAVKGGKKVMQKTAKAETHKEDTPPSEPRKKLLTQTRLDLLLATMKSLKANADKPTLEVSMLDIRKGIDAVLKELELLNV